MDISLETIINSYKETSKEFNYDEVRDYFKNKYPEILKSYELISPQKIITNLHKGDIIRYSKNQIMISKSAIIIDFIYKNDRIDYLLLKTMNYKNVWRLYPENHYIFLFDKNNLIKFQNIILEDNSIKKNNEDKYDKILNKYRNRKKDKVLSVEEILEIERKKRSKKKQKIIDKKYDDYIKTLFYDVN
jgi:hypothetical protein